MIKPIKEIFVTQDELLEIPDEEFIEAFKEKMLDSERKRAGLDKLRDEILTSMALGHWDLWDYNELREESCVKKISLPEDKIFYARDPFEDIIDNTVAIDFGTKSTVVAYKTSFNEFIPLRLSGYLDSKIDNDLYENPSVIHFVDFQSFLKDYSSRLGRPDTKLKDLNIGHIAFQELDSRNFESYFIDLKSWCCSNNSYMLKDEKGFCEVV